MRWNRSSYLCRLLPGPLNRTPTSSRYLSASGLLSPRFSPLSKKLYDPPSLVLHLESYSRRRGTGAGISQNLSQPPNQEFSAFKPQTDKVYFGTPTLCLMSKNPLRLSVSPSNHPGIMKLYGFLGLPSRPPLQRALPPMC